MQGAKLVKCEVEKVEAERMEETLYLILSSIKYYTDIQGIVYVTQILLYIYTVELKKEGCKVLYII